MENPVGLCAHVVSEPEGGTDIHLPYDKPGAALRVVAHKEGRDWVINGNKMFSSGGGVGGFLLALARTDKNGPISTSASAFWVLKDTPGVSFELNRMIMPDIYGNVQTHFDNVRVPESQVVGQVNRGFDVLGQIHGTKMVAFSSIIGYARNMYEQIVDYARQRVQGGKPVIQHSHAAAMLGEVAIMLEASRSMLYRGAMEIDQQERAGAPFNHFWSIAMFYLAKRLSLQIAELGAEIYGGISATIDLPFASWVQHVYVFLAGGGPMGVDKFQSSMWYNNHTLGEPWKET
jgi:alkylation response protein AidB-like acyl-CoA dehydrogenase